MFLFFVSKSNALFLDAAAVITCKSQVAESDFTTATADPVTSIPLLERVLEIILVLIIKAKEKNSPIIRI